MRYTHIRLVHNKWSQPQGLYAGKETSTQIDIESMLAPRTGSSRNSRRQKLASSLRRAFSSPPRSPARCLLGPRSRSTRAQAQLLSMLQDASLAVERAQSKKKQAEKRAEDAENQVGLLTVERDTLQQRYETSVSTASTAYRILAALQEQINLERSLTGSQQIEANPKRGQGKAASTPRMATSSVSKTSNIPHAVPRHHNNYARRCDALKAEYSSTRERVKRSTSSNIPCCPRQEAQAGGPGKGVHERETHKGGKHACSGNSTELDTIISEVLDFKQQNEALLQQLEESDKEIHERVLRFLHEKELEKELFEAQRVCEYLFHAIEGLRAPASRSRQLPGPAAPHDASKNRGEDSPMPEKTSDLASRLHTCRKLIKDIRGCLPSCAEPNA